MRAILPILLLAFTLPAHAQSATGRLNPAAGKEREVYRFTEQEPTFHGKLADYIKKNLHYPKAELEQKIEGKAIVECIVNENGHISDVSVIRSSGFSAFDKEALRLVKAMPAWNPGKQNGKAVNCYQTIIVPFALPGEK